MESLGGRKFLLTVVVILVGTAVQLVSRDGVSQSYAALLVGIVATYSASNAAITHKAISAGLGVKIVKAEKEIEAEDIDKAS